MTYWRYECCIDIQLQFEKDGYETPKQKSDTYTFSCSLQPKSYTFFGRFDVDGLDEDPALLDDCFFDRFLPPPITKSSSSLSWLEAYLSSRYDSIPPLFSLLRCIASAKSL